MDKNRWIISSSRLYMITNFSFHNRDITHQCWSTYQIRQILSNFFFVCKWFNLDLSWLQCNLILHWCSMRFTRVRKVRSVARWVVTVWCFAVDSTHPLRQHAILSVASEWWIRSVATLERTNASNSSV